VLFSGLSSSTVGAMAGPVLIEGFLDIRFRVFLGRLLRIFPALMVIARDRRHRRQRKAMAPRFSTRQDLE